MSTAKERQAKRRAKIKADPELYEAQLQKDRERKKHQREALRETMSEQQLQEHKLKERLRIKHYRSKKSMKARSSTNDGTPYRSRQALGKAIKRLKHGLPSSPRKQRFVVEKLARSVGVPVCSSSKKNTSAESEENKELVHSFYRTDDISWQAPGRKDCIIIRETTEAGERIKTTQQVRYMMMSLREAYNKLKEQYSTLKMSLSKFCELRPPNVKLFDHLPHQVCLCSYHENVRLLLLALSDHSSLSTKFSSFIEQVTCDATSKKCMTRECSTCVSLIDEFAPESSSVTLQYYQWKSIDSRIEKVIMTDTVHAVFNELKKQLSTFLLHTFVKRKQAASFDSLKTSCDGKSIVLQVDFSENATIAAQKEVQAAHWHHSQATIFTAHAWINNATNCSMVVISDDLDHTKYSIFVFMQCIFRRLQAKFPSIETINVFSDGPTSQFKQRFLFSNLHYWEQDHDISIRWNFFATSHGKGVVDGIGGTVKRAVWRHIRSEKSHITSPQEYSVLAKQLCPNIQVEYVTKSEIEQQFTFLDTKWEGVMAVPQTLRVHCIQAFGANEVKVADISSEIEESFRVCRIRNSSITPLTNSMTEQDSPIEDVTQPALNLSIGVWVVVKYDDEEFPGEVTCIEDSDIEVNVMHRSANAWKWPRPEDKIFYSRDQIVRVINPPSVAGNRGQFMFEDI